MKLISIGIENYRSIRSVRLDLAQMKDGSSTFGLIGLNEAGKSSILKAIALKEGIIPLTPKDFHEKHRPVVITFTYEVSAEKQAALRALFNALPETVPVEQGLNDSDFGLVTFAFTYALPAMERQRSMEIGDKTNAKGLRVTPPDLPSEIIHNAIFWTADEKYLISRPIDLAAFAAQPGEVSVPLRNCFLLAGIADIAARIDALEGDSTEIEHLQSELGARVTAHIKSVWPHHPIEITFLITNNQINFHVRDQGAVGKAKTADQRSDGFKQFVSFLLTVSAQNRNEELSNTILLLDEPETHLHPLAQEYLLGELKKITSNKRRNIALFATHSNYMIDKGDLSRNFRVRKSDDKTAITAMDKKTATYSSVTYEAFEIASSDYHNELFAKLHEVFQDEYPADEKRERVQNFDQAYFQKLKGEKATKPWKGNPNSATLPTYVRNCIHHPDNGDKFSDAELRASIEKMRKYLE